MGKTKDVRGAVEAELRFDPRIDAANIARQGCRPGGLRGH